MAERVAASLLLPRHDPGRRGEQPAPAPNVKHCWVNGRHGRLPGLLLEWRQSRGSWLGRVVHPIDEGQGWVIVEEWVDAGLLNPARPSF